MHISTMHYFSFIEWSFHFCLSSFSVTFKFIFSIRWRLTRAYLAFLFLFRESSPAGVPAEAHNVSDPALGSDRNAWRNDKRLSFKRVSFYTFHDLFWFGSHARTVSLWYRTHWVAVLLECEFGLVGMKIRSLLKNDSKAPLTSFISSSLLFVGRRANAVHGANRWNYTLSLQISVVPKCSMTSLCSASVSCKIRLYEIDYLRATKYARIAKYTG